MEARCVGTVVTPVDVVPTGEKAPRCRVVCMLFHNVSYMVRPHLQCDLARSALRSTHLESAR